MFKLEGGWMGQDQFERCSNLEIRTEKWMLPKVICPANLDPKLGNCGGSGIPNP